MVFISKATILAALHEFPAASGFRFMYGLKARDQESSRTIDLMACNGTSTDRLLPNLIMDSLKSDTPDPKRKNFLTLDLTPQIALANDPSALVNNVSTLLTGGTMSDHSRTVITAAVGKVMPDNDPEVLKERARMAVYLTMISPDYAIQK